MTTHGTFERIDGRAALRFVRHLPHPADRVWAAVTTPDDLAAWFPCRIDGELRVGGALRFVFPDDPTAGSGEVLAFDPPRSFRFSWDGDEIRIDVEPTADGCALTLCNLIADGGTPGAARTAAGWHLCLDELGAWLDGRPVEAAPTARQRDLVDAYVDAGVPHGPRVTAGPTRR